MTDSLLTILPTELIRLLALITNNSLTYYNLIQTNTLFLDILSAQDLINIKNNYKIMVCKYAKTYYILPNGVKHGKQIEIYYNGRDVSTYNNGKKYTHNTYIKNTLCSLSEWKYLDDGYIIVGRHPNNEITFITRYFTLDNIIPKTYHINRKANIINAKVKYTPNVYVLILRKFYSNGKLKTVRTHNNIDLIYRYSLYSKYGCLKEQYKRKNNKIYAHRDYL